MNDPQMSLLPSTDREQSARGKGEASSLRLGVVMDHRTWLGFLADEWWPLTADTDSIQLGVGWPCGQEVEGRITVTAWFDPSRLAAVSVSILRDGVWVDEPLANLRRDDVEVVWPGPLPLFAVESFAVPTQTDAVRLVALAKGLSNVGAPEQPIHVRDLETQAPNANPLRPGTRLRLPPDWDALRGAVAMATRAVPTTDPWFDLLCASLSRTEDAWPEQALAAMPWWRDVPWRRGNCAPADSLWAAMLAVFGAARLRERWNPHEILLEIGERIAPQQRSHFDELRARTQEILADQRSIDPALGIADPLGLVLQLVLLRPGVERFETWKDDLPAMPPAVWWTGATLAGIITGYRDLPLGFRGSSALRRALALRVWQFADDADRERDPAMWWNAPADRFHWAVDERMRLFAGDEPLAARRTSSRGSWYRVDLSDPAMRQAALALVDEHDPGSLRRKLALRDRRIETVGSGSLRVVDGALVVTGEVDLLLASADALVHELDAQHFRAWILNGSIAARLPDPPGTIEPEADEPAAKLVARAKPASGGGGRRVAEPAGDAYADKPPGLTIVQRFIEEDEERNLLALIDAEPWLDELKRRVQHYGWKYDYGKRKIEPEAYLGPLPDWLQRLGKKLIEGKLIGRMPDQVIVNEYIENQGISAHKDCPSCFVGPIVTVSLCETWAMVFKGPGKRKIELDLPRYSAVVLDGPARTQWTHEIPKRKKEGGVVRHRRVSLTFRKVAIKHD